MNRLPLLIPRCQASLPELDPKLPPAARQALLAAAREPALAAQADVLRNRVDRIVVLMLENRSFDHALGWLGPQNGGLTGTESNPLPAQAGRPASSVQVFRVDETALPISPPHAGNATIRQINGGAMDGFLRTFQASRQEEIADADPIEGHPPEHSPMAYYGPLALPAYRHLVTHHTVCTRYHASVPAGTWPNRMYLYAGTSNGLFGNGKAFPRDDAYDTQMPRKLLVDALTEAGVDWCVYTHGIAWMRLFPGRFKADANQTQHFARFDEHCRRGRLPPVVFIDPEWSDIGPDALSNDDLAPANLLNGQRLVAEVYNALRQLPDAQQAKTLLVVTYDEHGGFYDHVPPGPTIGRNASETDPRFATYGVRVPTFVVSPYAPAALADVVLDHASLYATIHRRFLPSGQWPSERAQVADTLATLLTLDAPRSLPPAIEVPTRAQARREDRRERRQQRRQDRREDRRERRAGEDSRPATAADDEDGGFRAWVAALRSRDGAARGAAAD